MEASISADNITVEFPIYENSHRSLKKRVLNLSTGGAIANDGAKHLIIRAIDQLTFNIDHGERIGLVGHNGSGKSTLLRVLSGVYAPIHGKLKTRGKIASLLDISMGLDVDATGFENIYLRGILEGLKPQKIKEKYEDIAEFSDLGAFLNFPVRTYSSGMMLRLAFAISTSVEADILIMDEWLSVGDEDFNKKVLIRLENLVNNAAILVIASHDQSLISRICTRKISLEHGKIISDVKIDKLA